jgi:outer membrane protein OmpA-like peptidoglycan-associated protein
MPAVALAKFRIDPLRRSNVATGNKFQSRRALALGAALSTMLVFGAGIALGDSVTAPSASSLVEALKSKGPTRGLPDSATADLIKTLKEKSSRGISITSEERSRLSEAVKTMPNYDMEILFELDSADISPKAQPAVEALGRALQDSQLKGANFVVAGHTDATGSAPYNQVLSERRAQSVRAALVKEFNLSNDQLIAVGYGTEQLKNPKDPYGAENRRVQIVNVGQQ